jgi:pimeloyl-ACP methyl ester carboxylesterase
LLSAPTHWEVRVQARSIAALVLSLVLLSACGSDGDSPNDVSEASIEEHFAVGSDNKSVALLCFGEGSPMVLFEPGSDGAGTEEFARVLRPLGEQTTACTYDRLGAGGSDPPSQRRRTLDDVVDVLHELIETAELPVQYVHVGASAGGGIALYNATRYPDDVAGVVLLDVPQDDPEAFAKEFPGRLAWRNPEHLDYGDALRRLAGLRQGALGNTPLRIVTASDGQSDVDNQSVWRKLSSDARQTTVAGGHDLSSENPDGVVAEVRAILEAIKD